MKQSPWMQRILESYLASEDFNGLHFKLLNPDDNEEVAGLVRDGLVQVVTNEDYLNPHIRPWPSRRTTEAQVQDITDMKSEHWGACLYPTPTALKRFGPGINYLDEPFRQAMADGRGTLELAYFQFEVLEPYRNDPRYNYTFYDFGAEAVVSDDVYMDDAEPDVDKVMMSHIGFAYDLSKYDKTDPNSPIIRRVCAFYGDLAELSSIHQQRWKTYQVSEVGLDPHPVWWGTQMGHWPDGMGPFQRLFFELEAINTLFEQAFGEQLFRAAERPREFGWLLRSTQSEWDSFIHQLDKLLSENLREDAFDAAGVPRKDSRDQKIGTLSRLARLLEARGVSADDTKRVLKPLRDVRSARQKPAHALRTNVTDKTFVHRQVALMEDITNTLEVLRRFWQGHPANAAWKEPDHVSENARDYRM